MQLYRLDGGSLFREPHGRVLLLKTLFVAVMLFVGLTARQVAQARLARAADLTPPTADRLRRAFGTEAVIGVVVIGLSGWMLSFTPGKVDTDDVDYAIEETIVDEANGLDVTVSLDPGRVGLNALRVEVREPESGHHGVAGDVRPADRLERARPIEQPISLGGRGVAQSPEGGGIPLSVPGAWTLQVSATTADRHVDSEQPVRRAQRRRRHRHPGHRLDPRAARRHRGDDIDHADDHGVGPSECLALRVCVATGAHRHSDGRRHSDGVRRG